MCHQSVGLVQRAIEAAGVPTFSVTMLPDVTRRVGVPRAGAVPYPLGHPFGPAGDPQLRVRLLRAALRGAQSIREPGAIVDLLQ